MKRPANGNRRSKGKVGEVVTMDGLAFAPDQPLKHFNHFHERLKGHAFFKEDFLDLNDPAGQAVAMDDDLMPDTAWTVKLQLLMRARSEMKSVRRTGRVLQAGSTQQPRNHGK